MGMYEKGLNKKEILDRKTTNFLTEKQPIFTQIYHPAKECDNEASSERSK